MLIVRDMLWRKLAKLEPTNRPNAYFITRLPACSIGEYLWLLNRLEELGLKIYE